jgi:hypothetical protein
VSRRTVKKLLLSFIAIGLLASITTGGTYAVLQGTQQNINSNVASGTLTLSDQVGAGTVCVSNSGSGTYATGTENENTLQSSPASAGCTALVTAGTLQYPGTLTQIHVTVENTGSVDGAKLYLYMYGASAGAGCAPTTTTGATVVGIGNPCSSSGDDFYVEEDDSSWSPLDCVYPAGAGACSITSGGTLNDFSTQYYTYVGHKLDLGAAPTSVNALPNQTYRYFTIGVEESNDNTMQGKTATFALTWHLDSST